MTENQEKELFLILGRLVNGVSEIQVDIRAIKATQAEHTQTLAEHSHTLAEHSRTLDDHSTKLDRLESKIDSVATQVMENDMKVTARIETVERAVEDLGGKIH